MSFIYKGLSAQLARHIVTDEEIDHHIQRLLQQTPRTEVINDRPTRLGDEVVLDYAGFCDGEQFAGGTAEKQTLTLGSGMFIPGFEEQLVGKTPGESVTVHVTFPEQYHSEELAGKAAEFRCTIHEIRVKTPYQPDDVFAREVGQCESFAEMRRRLGESLQAYSDERGEMDLQDRLLHQAAATLDISFTEKQLEAAVEDQIRNLQMQLAQQGLNLEMYCSFMNTTPDALRQDIRPTAEAALRSRAAVDKIVELENLRADQAELDEALEIICRQNDITMEQLRSHYDEVFEQTVIQSILVGKAMGLIREAANITVVTGE